MPASSFESFNDWNRWVSKRSNILKSTINLCTVESKSRWQWIFILRKIMLAALLASAVGVEKTLHCLQYGILFDALHSKIRVSGLFSWCFNQLHSENNVSSFALTARVAATSVLRGTNIHRQRLMASTVPRPRPCSKSWSFLRRRLLF